MSSHTGAHETYQIRITLQGMTPTVWRRIQIRPSVTLARLHAIIQRAMGWSGLNVHEFMIRGQRYGSPHRGNSHLSVVNDKRVRLKDVAQGGSRFQYRYDLFESAWEHELEVEEIVSEPAAGMRTWRYIDGQHTCPPEQCSGIRDYSGVLQRFRAGDHAPHRSEDWIIRLVRNDSVINVSGRQRMLSQRIVKAYCQIGLDLQRDDAREQLEESVQLFEYQQRMLRGFSSNPKVQRALAVVDAAWAPFKTIAVGGFSHQGAQRLLKLNEELLCVADQVVTQMRRYTDSPSGGLVNLSGRQRMLSQRLAKFYLLRELGFQMPSVASGLDQARAEFVCAHDQLAAAPEDTAEIRKHLANARIHWKLLDYMLQDERCPLDEFIVRATDKVLHEMDSATALYQALP